MKALVDGFNASGNPGAFALLNEGNKRYAVVGKLDPAVRATQPQEGILGVAIDLPVVSRSAMDALDAILNQVSHKSVRKVVLGSVPNNLLLQSSTSEGGTGVVARACIAKILDSTGTNLVWEALYDADDDTYFLNIAPAVKNYYDDNGKRATLPLKSR